MSIATSVLIRPSKIMRRLLLFIVGCSCLAWICVLSWFLLPTNLALAGVCLLITLLVFYVLSRKTIRSALQTTDIQLDVTGSGDVLLRKLDASGRVFESYAVKLRSPLILWSSLQILSLQNESGAMMRLLILRDSVSVDGFRRLSLAFHWLAQAQSEKQMHTPAQNDLS